MLGFQPQSLGKRNEILSVKVDTQVDTTGANKKYEKFLNDTLTHLQLWSGDSLRMVECLFQAAKKLELLKQEDESLFPVLSSITSKDVGNFFEKKLPAINEVRRAMGKND